MEFSISRELVDCLLLHEKLKFGEAMLPTDMAFLWRRIASGTKAAQRLLLCLC